MKLKLIYSSVIVALCILCLPACDNQWDDHVEVKINRETESIMQVIESNPETSTFAAILKAAGYDKLLSGDKSLTVFAPVNSALGSVDMNDTEALRSLVQNHIAYLSYSVKSGSFTNDTIEMLNSKRLKTEGKSLDGIALKDDSYNITTANGILHVIEGVIYTKENIWQYIQTQGGYSQVDFLVNMTYQVMDMEKSVQTNIDSQGRPVYDTIWMDKNAFLDEYPINDESKNFTFVLLEPAVMNTIETKYAKYFVRPEQQQQDSIVRVELLKDCVLLPAELTANNKFLSVDGVLLDVSSINGSPYKASNGIVYKLSGADVKVYQNKLKDIIIEAEDYVSLYSDGDAWASRRRSWASGGEDIMMDGNTRNFFNDSIINDEGEKVAVSETYTYDKASSQNDGYKGRVTNCYMEFRPVLNSVGYKMSCVSADDIPSHYQYTSSRSQYWFPMILEQKLLISFPDIPRLRRLTTATDDRIVGGVENNFSETTVFVSKARAAEVVSQPEETPFYRYNVDLVTTTVKGAFVVAGRSKPEPALDDVSIYQESDEYGDKEILICPRYGESTVFIANAVREIGTNSGMIFLDYIRFSPVVDPND